MLIDLLHNKILRETITEQFTDSVKEKLCPLVSEIYGEDAVGICMYEDYIADGFNKNGVWYYPLTVKTSDAVSTLWICWSVAQKSAFKGGNPYAYVGKEPLEFDIPELVPDEFTAAIKDRAISYSENTISLKVHSDEADPLILAGKYSQTFLDELARQITSELSRALGIEGIENSTMELQFVFAPMTFMEHTSENVTYRRLLLTDKSCMPRDFWVKWTRLDGAVSYSVTDVVNENTICFELGEDVPQKIREKEYRFLCSANPDKYQSAMGKKTVTEWRDLIKRAIRRGDVVKVVNEVETEEVSSDVNDKLAALLNSFGMSAPAPEAAEQSSTTDFDLSALARAALGEEIEDDEAPEEEDFTESEDALRELRMLDSDEEEVDEEVEEEIEEIEEDLEESEDVDAAIKQVEEQIEEAVPSAPAAEAPEAALRAEEDRILREMSIRAEIEAKIRLEYEAEARARAEEEARRLREEREALRAENERLAAAAKYAEEQRALEESARLAEIEKNRQEAERRRIEEERLRAQLEEQKRQEARERDRLAEAARIAVEEQRRIEAEKQAREAREREAAVRREAERLAREEAARFEEEKRRELDRILHRNEPAPTPAPAPVIEETYLSKSAKLLFRYNIDLNVIKRIKDIVEQTLVVLHKENVPLHIKASPKDATTIQLDIMRLPASEQELLVKIIKAIGEGNIGVYKIILE